MKHLELFENYGDIISDGENNRSHVVFSIDDDWVLKMPKKADKGETEYAIMDFNEHIRTMKTHPEIFLQLKN